MDNHLEVIQEGNLLWLYLNRPLQKNAIDDQMIDDIEKNLEQASDDKNIRVVILGARGNVFCAGGDTQLMAEKKGMFAGDSHELRTRYQKGIQRIPLAMEKFEKPLIAMVDGPAIGAGCDLTLMADLRIASPHASFTESFARLSLVPGDGGTFFLPRVIGYARAMEMFLSCQTVKAEKALEWGLINKLVKAEDLEKETRIWGEQIAMLAPVALQMTKRALKMRFSSLPDQLEILSTYQGIAQRLQDHDRGLKALSEKKSAHFEGN